MKRFIVFICLLCIAGSIYAHGRSPKEKNFSKRFPYRYELRLGYGATPMYDTDNFMRTGYFYKYDYVTGPYEPSLDNLTGFRKAPDMCQVYSPVSSAFITEDGLPWHSV